MSILIERALPSDASGILEFLKQVGGETDNLTFGGEGLPFTVEEEAAYLSQLEKSEDSVMLLAKENDRIIGSASLFRLSRRMAHRGELSICVAKAHWNRGVGGMMLENLLAFAREQGFEILELQVRSDNSAAIHLYEKFGFQKIGTHPGFFCMNNAWVPFDFMCLLLK